MERVTGIEPALSAWESTDFGPNTCFDLHFRQCAGIREIPRFTPLNGPLMARSSGVKDAGTLSDWSGIGQPRTIRECSSMTSGLRDRELERRGTLGTLPLAYCPREWETFPQVRVCSGTLGTPGTFL